MIEKPDPHTVLVAEVFHEDWATGSAGALARRAAAHARRRRAVRSALAVGGAVAVVVAGFFISSRHPLSTPAPVVSNARPVAAVSPAFEIISDEELIAALRGRPMLVLPLETGAKRFVLLDR